MLWAPPMLYVDFCPVHFWLMGTDRLHCSAKISEKELDFAILMSPAHSSNELNL